MFKVLRGDGQEDNPLTGNLFVKILKMDSEKDGFQRGIQYQIMLVPNIVNITYGRGVGYAFEEETFDESISASKIRKKRK